MPKIEISDMEKDALGEVMNISMGSAATAVSELLSAKVWITTPRVEIVRADDMLQYDKLEPAVCVKIEYVKGLSGNNLMVLRQDDVQMILNQLMGQPLVVTPDFEFDELNISAVSEVMNQMMGASATALSDFLGIVVDISTPTPYIMENIDLSEVQDFEDEEEVAAIYFDLTIDGVIKSEFCSVLTLELAKFIADKVLGTADEPAAEPAPAPAPAAAAPAPSGGGTMSQAEMDAMFGGAQPQMPQGMPQMQPGMPQMPQGMPPQGMPGQMPYGAYPPPQYGYQQPYPYPQMPYGGYPQPMNVQNAQLNAFDAQNVQLTGEQKTNLQLLMGVPLEISVEIGTARRKVKEILEFTQGTIIELERQAGAPVDIIVNGNLIAKGDIVVIDDNFAVRITEIIKSKLMDSINKE
ncbi:MAG: flagellar motor switch phosphatase FliY [Ruminiclostridium sp.]|nr:flagellar motor switch phosphatase FliY [Ruminiclostridium sp.]